MEFDLSKENIQPLRGGRNVSQLDLALQAQNNEDIQKELLQQKERFENTIRTYDGDDPLHNWYQYISWIEQSYPKQGHEGNLVTLLEDCLGKFENDRRYLNDVRFCKLWIKYNDLQQNPLELYQMMHARGLCRGCTDLYRAWAYYHEAGGDYRSADIVFQLGKRELAQPYEELIIAHQNMIYAAGQQVISGVDEQRLLQQRQALTTLHTSTSGKVGSIRMPSSIGAGILPSTSNMLKPNSVITVFEDRGEFVPGAEAPPVSILSVAKRQVAPKENTIKPGAWTGGTVNIRGGVVHRTPKFIVHQDIEVEPRGLIVPLDFYQVTHEDFSNWKPMLCYAEPEDATKFPMYPKSKVYCDTEVEYSIEEIRANRYLPRSRVFHAERNGTKTANKRRMHEFSQVDENSFHEASNVYHQMGYEQTNPNLFQQEQVVYNQHPQSESLHQVYGSPFQDNAAAQYVSISNMQAHVSPQLGHASSIYQENNIPQPINNSQHLVHVHQEYKTPSRVFRQNIPNDTSSYQTHQNKSVVVENVPNEFGNELNVLWNTPESNSVNSSMHQMKPNISKFAIYEETSYQELLPPKGSAMKTTPFKILSDEDLAETGSRGGHDIAAAAQPGDGAKRIVILEDDSSSPYTENTPPKFADLNATCNTQVFNFNLNAMKVSTPQSKQSRPSAIVTNNEAVAALRKQLFDDGCEKKRMSTILEETAKSSSSTSGGSSLKSATFSNSKRETMAVISEEQSSYHFNLAQNLKANAALRTSVLEVMECDSQQNNPLIEAPVVVPLVNAPSDPFKPALLCELLERIQFPERHNNGYIKLQITPRLGVRKEVTTIGNDKYYISHKIGEGTYGQVYKAIDAYTNRTVALKLQKPPNCWEYYICKELQKRLAQHPLKECFMDIEIGYFNDQVSVFLSEFSPCGSLLDAVNTTKLRTGHPLKQSLCVYFCIKMLKIISVLHEVKIIHADIKPDNFLVYVSPDTTLQLQLIDFGCSIDMTFFPPGTEFRRQITTKDFICCEIQDGRPWSYHTDLFCVAATAHVMLFDKYMQLQKRGNNWSITQRFTRYMRCDLWNEFFSRLLNQQDGPADPQKLISLLTDALPGWGDEINMEMRKLANMLNNR